MLRDRVLAARGRLVAAGIEPNEAAMDAELLAREVLGWDRGRFLAHDTDVPPPSFESRFADLVARRARREPVSEILGRREFWGLDFEVTPDVLTPRPETEIIVEEAIARVTDQPAPIGPEHAAPDTRPRLLIADVGTGTGCLAIILAREFPASAVIATDVSPAALEVARRNAARHGVLDRIDFRQTSLLDGLELSFDLIVSNPPYIPAPDIASLPPEVREFEPREALDGGPDGLDIVRRLMQEAHARLKAGGLAIVEFGFGQEAGVRDAVAAAGLELAAVRADLQGIPRTVVARRGAPIP